MIRFLPHIIAAAALAGAVWYVVGLRASNAALSADLAAQTLKLSGCHARAKNRTEDGISDATIDNRDDDDLRGVPDHWMRRETDSGGVQ